MVRMKSFILFFIFLISDFNNIECACTLTPGRTNKTLEERRLCAVEKGVQWLLDRRNDEWGWGERQEAEAIIALHLANDSWVNKRDSESYISVKQMNIDLLVPISTDNNLTSILWSRGKLGHYVCGLKATCQVPRNFYGHDLIQKLETHMVNSAEYFQGNKFAYSWAILAICNSNETVKDRFMSTLTQNPGNYTLGIDEAAMTLMALSCVNSSSVKGAKTAAEHYIIQRQNKDGSFGSFSNEYTTGLSIQALLASGRKDVDYKIDKAIEALINIQAQVNGAFKNVAAANQALPALARKSYLDIGRLPCVDTGTTDAPKTGNTIQIKISVEADLSSHVNRTWTVVIPEGDNLYNALLILQKEDPDFSFTSVSTSWGPSIKSIVGVAASSSARQYWSLVKAPKTASKTGVSSTIPKANDHYIFRLATY